MGWTKRSRLVRELAEFEVVLARMPPEQRALWTAPMSPRREIWMADIIHRYGFRLVHSVFPMFYD